MLDRGYTWQSNAKECKIMNGEEIIVAGMRSDNMFVMNIEFAYAQAMVATSGLLSLGEWHRRLAHQNLGQVRLILKQRNIKFKEEIVQCEACIVGKMTRKTFRTTDTVTTKCGEIVHGDVAEVPHRSLAGSKYFLIMKDYYSHYRCIYFLKKKDEVGEKIESFVKFTSVQVNLTIKVLRTDNGTKFVNKRLAKLFADNGIHHQTTVPYNAEQNGSAERDIRTITEAARTMLYARGMNLNLWAGAANTAVFVLNRTGTSSVPNKTPIEAMEWTGNGPFFFFFN